MKRINDEWLSDKGRFFLVCPNANAPSRQIAVKMGLITHNNAITPAEEAHDIALPIRWIHWKEMPGLLD